MEQRKELWDLVKIVSTVCTLLGVPAFFYFFGYRLTREWSVDLDKLSWENPFLYVVIAAVVLGSVVPQCFRRMWRKMIISSVLRCY